MEATIVDGNGTETDHIIVTTIGGKNGQPKQVICPRHISYPCKIIIYNVLECMCTDIIWLSIVADYKLYGRACCWSWIFWSSFPGA